MINTYLKKIGKRNYNDDELSHVDFVDVEVNYDEPVTLPILGSKTKKMVQRALNYCNNNQDDTNVPNEFKEYIIKEINFYKEYIEKRKPFDRKIVKVAERYIMFIDTLVGTSCIDYIKEIAENFKIKNDINDILDKERNKFNEEEYEDFIYTINTLSKNLPDTNIFFNLFGSLNIWVAIISLFVFAVIIAVSFVFYKNPELIKNFDLNESLKKYYVLVYGEEKAERLFSSNFTDFISLIKIINGRPEVLSRIYFKDFIKNLPEGNLFYNSIVNTGSLLLTRIIFKIVFIFGSFLICRYVLGFLIDVTLTISRGIKSISNYFRRFAIALMRDVSVREFLLNILTPSIKDVKDSLYELLRIRNLKVETKNILEDLN